MTTLMQEPKTVALYCEEIVDGVKCGAGPYKDPRGLAAHKNATHSEEVICENCQEPKNKHGYPAHLRKCVAVNRPVPKFDLEQWNSFTISDMHNLKPETREALLRAGLYKISDLLSTMREEFLAIPGFGQESMEDLDFNLKDFGTVLDGTPLAVLERIVPPKAKYESKSRREKRAQVRQSEKVAALKPSPVVDSPVAVALKQEIDKVIAQASNPITELLSSLRTEQSTLSDRLDAVRGEITRLERLERALSAPSKPVRNRIDGAGAPPMPNAARLVGHISEDTLTEIHNWISRQPLPVTREQVWKGIGKKYTSSTIGHALVVLRSREQIRWCGRGGVSGKAHLYTAKMEG